MRFLKRLFCKHEYSTLYNIHGDMINWCGGYRRFERCTKCGKGRYGDSLDENCHRVNG